MQMLHKMSALICERQHGNIFYGIRQYKEEDNMEKIYRERAAKPDKAAELCSNNKMKKIQTPVQGKTPTSKSKKPQGKKVFSADKQDAEKTVKKQNSPNGHNNKNNKILFTSIMTLLTLGIIIAIIWISVELIKKDYPNTAGASDSVESQLDAILEGDNNLNVISNDGQRIDSLAGGETSAKILNCISYSVISTEVDGDTASSVIKFKIPDIVTMTEQFVQSQQDDTEFKIWLKEQLDGDYPIIEKEVTLKMVYQDKRWSLVATDDLYNILTGGALEYYIAQRQSAYDILKEAMANEENN